MAVFTVSGNAALEGKYKGAGYAIGAITGDQLIDFAYLQDILDVSDIEGPDDVVPLLDDPRLGPTVRHMQALGDVSVGMLSCYEFVEL